MRTFLFSIITLLLLLHSQAHSQCKLAGIISDHKMNIPKPFKYDGFNLTNINFDQQDHLLKTEFMAFKGQKYKLMFCTSGFEELVTITVFDKENPELKVTEKILGDKDSSWTFEPPKAGTYSVMFNFPPSNTGVEHKECIVMLIGFSEKK